MSLVHFVKRSIKKGLSVFATDPKKRIAKEFLKRNGKEYADIVPYLYIDGWLTEIQAITLYNLARNIQANNDPVCVEIGSWLGKSSFLIAKGLQKSFTNPKLFCIDPFNADGDDSVSEKQLYQQIAGRIAPSSSLYKCFCRNMENTGVIGIITPLKGYSTDFSASFKERIDLLFIDGNHTYDAVKKDFFDWSPLLKTNGFVVFHDVDFDPNGAPGGNEEHPGPGLVIKEFIINNAGWKNPILADGLFYAQKAML